MPMRLVLVVVLLHASRLSYVHAEEFTWQTAAPESQGLSRERLELLREDLARRGTKTFLVIRHDRIVFEWYAEGFGPQKTHGTASLAKALIGGMSLAVAMQDGRIKPDDHAAALIPQWRDDPIKSKITIAQLATHSSGLDDANEEGIAHEDLTGWKGDFWRRTPDPFTISRDLVSVVFPPGSKVGYSNPGMAMLAYAVTAAIQPGEQKDIRSLLRERILRPIGVDDKEWTIGYGQTYRVEGFDLVANWGGAAFTPRAAARVGRLMLREGDWEGQRILDEAVVRACVDAPAAPDAGDWEGPASPRPGFGWWTNRDKVWKSVPRNAYLGAGAGQQLIIIIPSLDMIVVRNGSNMAAREPNWVSVEKYLLAPLMAAVIDPPYPPSDVIRSVRFDPPGSIIRQAIGSDNWPMTWADDGHLYTAYGDGQGFEPFTGRKLSLGLARIEGDPPAFKGVNIRSQSVERTGDGLKGPKASGMLMVEGVFYMWVRNTNNATLTWSADHGQTWTWGFTFDTSFGCPTFLNFGRNYEGAADAYIYVYSQDGPSAYEPYDGIVLARVPKTRVRDRSAYELFTRLDDDGRPEWTSDIGRRGHIFRYLRHCERLDAVYNPGLRRYLLTVSFGHGKGWAIFDAPKPWGPWTVAHHTNDWHLGDTHGYRLPAKWVSPDGTTIWLVFSGRQFGGVNYDAFCARRTTLDLYPELRTEK